MNFKKIIVALSIVALIILAWNKLWPAFIVVLLVAVIVSRLKNTPAKEKNDIPTLTKAKESHYEEKGLSDDDIDFFREIMAQTKERIVKLEANTNTSAKLKAIDLRHQSLDTCKSIFKQLVDNPKKLHKANHFLYTHLPNFLDLTDKYVEINQHTVKDKTTYEALGQTEVIIEQVADLISSDYKALVADDLDDLDTAITIAKTSLKDDNKTNA